MSERELPPTDSLSPEMQRLIKSQISRRTALTGAGALGMTAFLAACGTKGTANTNSTTTQKATADLSDSQIFGWVDVRYRRRRGTVVC